MGAAAEAARPSLPETYGESRLLLLARDPRTLFAAWDIPPSLVSDLKARIGSRAFAVSTLTLRVTGAGRATTEIHVGKRARSRYLKVDGAPSFVAEIGFTPPTGRFEFIARSERCVVSLGSDPGTGGGEARPRTVLGYREARALARRGLLFSSLRETIRARSTRAKTGVTRSGGPSKAGPPSPRSASSSHPTSGVFGGASDLYRR